MSNTRIRRDLPNDEYQAAVGANNASASNVFATIADLTSSDIPVGIAVGTNTYASTIPGVTSYNDGDAYIIKFTNGNDADSTIDINGLGVKTLTKQVGVQVTGGDILSGQEIIIIYDGTNFQCIGLSPNQLFAFVTNAEAITITKGQPVYAFSGTGNRMSVKLASNTSDTTSAQTVGLVYSSSIAANQTGFIIIQGVISGVNTGAYTAGNQLYLGATAGTLTNVKPYAPNHLVYIGIVERANAGNGLIYVRTQNGYELDELHDVDLITTPPTDGQVLTYDSVTGLWRNETPTSSVNIYNTDGTITGARLVDLNGNSIDFQDITGNGQFGIILDDGTTKLGDFRFSAVFSSLLVGDNAGNAGDVFIDTNQVRLRVISSGGSVTRKIEVTPSGVDVNGAYVFPNTDGTAGQVMTTNGAGVTSWQTPSAGSSTWNVTTQAGANYTAAANDYVLVNAATHTVTLPAAANGIRVGVKMINSTVTNIRVLTPSPGVTIDGVNRSVTGLPIFNQYDAYTFVCDGTNWWIMG